MKIAESFFVNNGDTTKVQLKYPWLEEAIYMQTPKNEYRLKNGKVERNDGVGWVVPRTEDPDYHKNLILQADQNKKEEPKSVIKYYLNKIFKQEQGGTMNYTQYLQDGAELAQPEIENRLGEKEVNELVQRIIQGDEEAAQILVENAIKDPENGYIVDTLAGAKTAAEQGNETAQKLLEVIEPMLQQAMQTQLLKCGGSVRAKVKKAKCGKKMETGSKIKKAGKGCPCTMYKKVGGRLIEVSCDGVPVAKNGTKIVYSQTPAMSTWGWALQSLPEEKPAYMYDLEAHRDPLLDGMIAYRSLQDKQKAEAAAQARAQKTKEFENTFAGGGINYGRTNPFLAVRESMMPQEQPAYNPYAELQQSLAAKRQAALAQLAREKVAAQAAASAPQTTWKDAFGAGKQGKFGGLTYNEAIARQKEMQAAKAQGFNVDLGRWGADGKWGNQSRSEWERYQQWKADQELAALKAQNAGLLKLEAPVAAPAKITPDNSSAGQFNLALTKTGQIVNLDKITAGQALSQLNNSDWNTYQSRLRQNILSRKDGGKLISYKEYLK